MRLSRRRPSRLARARPGSSAGLVALLALLALLAGCGAAPLRSAPAPAPAQAPEPSAPPADPGPALRALQAALAEGSEEGDDLATRLVAGLRARGLGPGVREVVDSAERVLTGRALVRGLELWLESEPLPERAGSYRLLLGARSRSAQEICLRLPPCTLERKRESIDARGLEGIEYDTRSSPALAELRLVAGGERRVELLIYELPLGRALGVRERWRLDTRSGDVECADQRYPAARVRVAACERERLSPFLSAEPVGSSALAEALAGEGPGRAGEWLELAVRTPPAAREAALRALAPVVAALAEQDPARVERAEPALRWLTQNRALGADAAGWARYLALQVRADGRETSGAPGGLDLPARPHSSEARQR